MATVRIDALLQSLREIVNRLSDSLHRDLIPRLGQTLLQRLNQSICAASSMPSPPGCSKSIAFRSGEFGGQSPLARCGLMSTEMWSGQFSVISVWVASALCAGAPSCKNVQIWSPKCLRTHGKTFDRNIS
uniref:Uncharacterized protein n=1 Tax=Acrobeloides nanus TaxID=290746 RepID=A0A914D548_9BILA